MFLFGASSFAQINPKLYGDEFKLQQYLTDITYQKNTLPDIPRVEVITGQKQFIRTEPLPTEFNHFNEASLMSYPLDLSNELKNNWSVKFKIKKTNIRYFLRP